MALRVVIALLVSASLGCSFIEELDSANEEMNRYSPTARKEAEAKAAGRSAAAAPAPSEEDGNALANLAQWWQSARSVSSEPVDETIVRCKIGISVQFMREHDCSMRGGRVTE